MPIALTNSGITKKAIPMKMPNTSNRDKKIASERRHFGGVALLENSFFSIGRIGTFKTRAKMEPRNKGNTKSNNHVRAIPIMFMCPTPK